MARDGRLLAGLGLTAMLALTGCATGVGAAMSGEELLRAAKAHNLRFKTAVAGVQAQLHRGHWESGGAYGAVPGDWLGCGDDEYQFSLDRMGPIGVLAQIEPGPLAQRLVEDGWSEVAVREFPGVSGDVVVVGRKPSAAVTRLIVTFYEYPRGVSVTADSTCAPGDSWELLQLMEGGTGALPEYPQRETPADVPLFESGG